MIWKAFCAGYCASCQLLYSGRCTLSAMCLLLCALSLCVQEKMVKVEAELAEAKVAAADTVRTGFFPIVVSVSMCQC